jgi:hypothetical protein
MRKKKTQSISTVVDIEQQQEHKINPILEAIDKIISGTARNEDYENLYEKGVEAAPQSYLAFITKSIILSRRSILISLYKWTLPLLRVGISIADNETYKVPPIQVAVVVKKGNGATTLARTFFSALMSLVEKDSILKLRIAPFFVDRHGGTAGRFPENSSMFPIFVMDGIPTPEVIPQQIRKQYLEFLGTSPVFCFIEEHTQLKTVFNQEPFILRVPDLTPEEILEIARINSYIPESEETINFAERTIKELLSKDVSPKTILNILAESGNILLRDVISNPKEIGISKVERAFSTIMKNHTDIATFETVPLNLLEDYIKAEIYDQDEAVKDVTDSIAMLQYGLNDSDKPIHSMLFLGPTGVGKTELAIVLSKALFGRKDIVRIDMSEYSQPHHVEKLFGSAPGYVGYGQETKLTREIKRRNKGIILLDEIEKAHPEVHNALLQLLDYGKFTTGTGAVIDATGYIIIMTSNALVKEAGSFTKQIGFGEKIISDVKNDQKARKLLIERENFSPEFVNRIDSVIYFDSISDRTAEKILIKFMKEMKDSLMDKGITLTWSEAYIKDLISKRDPNFGGRGVRRLTSTPKMEIISILRKNPSLKEINLDVSEENPSRLSTKSILS